MESSGAAITKLDGPALSLEGKQRVQAVDTLRGLALLGMLLVHFQYYVHDDSLWSGRINSAVDFLAVDRFYPLFALLFGTGFTLQLTRWGDRPGFVAMYLRRLTALMGFAVLLIGLTGYKVLESYAFWALPLLCIRRWSNRALIVVFLCATFAHPLVDLATWQWEKHHLTVEESNARVAQELRYWPDVTREGDRLRDEGTLRELVTFRLKKIFGVYLTWQNYVPGNPFTFFVLGMLAVRLRIFQEPARYRKLLIGIVIYGSLAGIFSLFINRIVHFEDFASQRLGLAVRDFCYAVCNEEYQGMAYASAMLLWIVNSPSAHGLMRFLALPGRLSLTNYVVQVSILEIFFATSHPIIWLNRWGALLGVAVVFGLQAFFSQGWMGRYRFGPMEWVWRCFTFGKWEPLRR